ncbi:MAG: hypothetical protein ACXVAY_01980 [Mucilaginibacter sp.]
MKYLRFGIATVTIFLFSCNNNNEHKDSTIKINSTVKSTEVSNDKQEIQALIRKVLNWADSKNSIDLLPALTDEKDSTYIGFDLEKLKVNVEKLQATNLFSIAFIENYNQIILTLDKKVRNKEFDKWQMGELPTFSFANDVNPWCSCQDNMSWDLVNVEVINLNNTKGELYWNWGKPKSDWDAGWKEFKYKFGVEKENGIWKISYMQGFDFKQSVRKDGV